MKKQLHDPAQLDLLEWAAKRPTATVINWIPYLAKRMWRDRYVELPRYVPHIVQLRRRA